jgi:gliding motility associated protien GldN
MVEKINASGDPVLEDLFWIYFPEARFVFANSEVFNRINDAERRTYEDVFWKRQFESTVIKESNVYDRSINEYKTGLDALLEAEKIEEKIFNFEHDFWHY